jgi:hypothetical protein
MKPILKTGIQSKNALFLAYFTHPSPGYNVIGIDYAPLASWDNYFMAAENAVRYKKWHVVMIFFIFS